MTARTLAFLLLVFLLPGCAAWAPPSEDTTALLLATEKLDEAKVATFKSHSDRLKIFRDQLLSRALGEIEQGRMDDVHRLYMAYEKVDPQTGTRSLVARTPELAEIDAINSRARGMTLDAIKHVEDAFASSQNLQAEKDFEAVYDALRLYWMTRLTQDQAKQALAEQLKDIIGAKTEGK